MLVGVAALTSTASLLYFSTLFPSSPSVCLFVFFLKRTNIQTKGWAFLS